MSNAVQYTDMKDSGIKWIGSVPASWNVRTLYQLVTRVNNKNSDLAEQNLLSLSYGKIKRKDINTNDGLLPASFDGYNIIEAGDIVLRLTDLQNDHTSLRVGHATERGIITSAYTTLRPINPAHSRYLYYLIHAFDLKKGFYGMGSGVRQGLNYDEIKELRVVVPPQKEQDAIIAFLDEQCSRIDELIEEAKSNLMDYRKWRDSIIYEAVTKGLNRSSKMKTSGVEWIGDIPSHWNCCKQKYVIQLINGRAYKDSEFEENGKYRILRVGNLFSNSKWYTSSLELEDEKYCKDGDLLYAWSMSYGPVIWSGDKVIYHYHIWKTKLNESIDTKFAYYYFVALSNNIRAEAHATTMGFVTMQSMNNSYIAYPGIDEQQAIASYLDKQCGKIDEFIAEKQKLITDLELYKKSLVYETVTGKRKVV